MLYFAFPPIAPFPILPLLDQSGFHRIVEYIAHNAFIFGFVTQVMIVTFVLPELAFATEYFIA